MRTLGPGNEARTENAAVNVNRPQPQQAGQAAMRAVISPVAWVRGFSIDDRLKVNNVKLMPTKSLCSIGLSLETFHDMVIVKKIILEHLKKCSTVACWLGLVVAVLVIIDVEVTHRSRKGDEARGGSERLSLEELEELNVSEITAVVTKSIISLLTLLMCSNVYLTYTSICKFDIARNLLPGSATVFNSKLLSYFLSESLLCLLHIPPLVDRYFDISYKLQLFVLFRLYVVARYMKEHNQFTRNKTCLFLASVTETELSNMFLFKTFLKKMPFRVIVTAYFLNIFLGAYVIHIIEENNSYLDSTWMVIVTMTTLGYGDVVPVTFFGRFVTGMMSVLGIFLMALLISVIHETLQLSQNEKRILAHIDNAEHYSQRKIAAAKLIQSYWRFYIYIKANRESIAWKRLRQITRAKKLKNHLYSNLHNWREHKRIYVDHWYKEFISDNIAMKVTDVSRAVDQVQSTLNSLNYNQALGRSTSSRRDFQKESTIYEENEESPTWINKPVVNPKIPSEPQWEYTDEPCHNVSYKDAQSKRDGMEHESTLFSRCSSQDSIRNCPALPVEQSRREIERKLGQMEDYLDGFYAKAKSDIREIKKLFRDEILPTGVVPVSPDKLNPPQELFKNC